MTLVPLVKWVWTRKQAVQLFFVKVLTLLVTFHVVPAAGPWYVAALITLELLQGVKITQLGAASPPRAQWTNNERVVNGLQPVAHLPAPTVAIPPGLSPSGTTKE